MLLNELLDEAVRRCQRLSAVTEGAATALDTLTGRVRSLGEAVAAEAADAHARAQELDRGLSEAEDALEDAEADVRERLGGVRRGAQEVADEVSELLRDVTAAVAALRAEREATAAELEVDGQEAEAALTELARQIGVAAESARARAAAGVEAVSEVCTAAGKLRTVLAESFLRLHDELDEFEDEVAGGIDALLDSFEAALAAQAAAFQELAARFVAAHNPAVHAFASAFTEESSQELASALGPLRAATEEVEQMAETGVGLLAGRSGELAAALESLRSALNRIDPALASVAGIA